MCIEDIHIANIHSKFDEYQHMNHEKHQSLNITPDNGYFANSLLLLARLGCQVYLISVATSRGTVIVHDAEKVSRHKARTTSIGQWQISLYVYIWGRYL